MAGREDLLDEMTALIGEQIDTAPLEHEDWRVGFVEFARSYRRAFAGHRRIVATVSARPVRTDVALGAYDRAFAAFERFGWDGHTASVVMAAIDFLVLGSAIETFKGGFDRPADAYDPEYPHLASALCAAGDDDVDDLGFELGLAAVVAWLERVEAKTTQG
jgi:hypothetical protein